MPLTRKRVRRDDGRISTVDEETYPFDSVKLLREGERLCGALNAAGLVGDDSIIFAVAVVDFIEAVTPYAAPESLAGLRRTRYETRDRLHAAGVKL